MFDDMISTAGSICGAAKVIHRPAPGRFTSPPRTACSSARRSNGSKRPRSTTVVITDTIPLRPKQMLPKIKVLTVAALLGEAIKRIHRNESVSRLFV